MILYIKITQNEEAIMSHLRFLFPVSQLPKLHTPVEHNGAKIKFTGVGKTFKIAKWHKGMNNQSLADFEGQDGCYAYYEEYVDPYSKLNQDQLRLVMEDLQKHNVVLFKIYQGNNCLNVSYFRTEAYYFFDADNTRIVEIQYD